MSVEDTDGLSEGIYSQKTEELLPMKLIILKNGRITTHEVANIFLSVQSNLEDNLNLMPNLSPTCFVCA